MKSRLHNLNDPGNLAGQATGDSSTGLSILESTMSNYGLGGKSFVFRDPVASLYGSGEFIHINHGRRRVSMPCKTVAELVTIIESMTSRLGDDMYAVGFIGYEFACRSIASQFRDAHPKDIPLYFFHLYDSGEIIEHHERAATIDELIALQDTEAIELSQPFQSTFTKSEYLERVKRIKHHIREGDIYQANLTNRFTTKSNLDGLACYGRLRSLNPAPYSAYINCGSLEIISSSPECLLTKSGRTLETRPIKGTRPRGEGRLEDERLKRELVASEKDRAELLMITDLSRNDLGRVARPGSVQVTGLHQLETYSSVHHLVSYIEAELDHAHTLADAMQALLPGASITGAPKLRAVEILRQLEPVPRLAYTGSIGYIHKGNADFNIAIRTIVKHEDTYMVNAGGGIVADSDPEAEYDEMMTKAANLFKAVSSDYEVHHA